MKTVTNALLFLFFAVSLILPHHTFAQNTWIPVNMPGNGMMQSVFVNSENALFAQDVNGYGFYRSATDDSWTAVYPGDSEAPFGKVFQDHDTLVSPGWDNSGAQIYLYKSDDFGATWSKEQEADFLEPYARVDFFAYGEMVYYGQGDSVVYLSEDFGTNWNNALDTLDTDYIQLKMAVSTSTHHYITTTVRTDDGYEGYTFRIAHGTDNIDTLEAHLNEIYTIKDDTLISATTQFPGTVYYISSSDDAWQEIGPGNLPTSTRGEKFMAYVDGMLITLGGLSGVSDRHGGIYYTTLDGAAWNSVAGGLPLSGVSDLAANSQMWALATNSGILVSTDQGTTWKSMLSGLPGRGKAFQFRETWGEKCVVSAYGTYHGTGGNNVAWNYTGGGLFSVSEPKLSVGLLNSGQVVVVNDTLYMFADEGGLYRKTDADGDWHSAAGSGMGSYRGKPFYFDQTLFAGGLFGLYGTKDGGATWQDYGEEDPHYGSNPVFYEGTVFEDSILVYGHQRGEGIFDKIEGLYVVNHRDTTWHLRNRVKLRVGQFLEFAGAGGHLYAVNDQTVFRLKPNKTSWDTVEVGYESGTTLNSLIGVGNILLLGTNAGGYVSADGGMSWNAVSKEGLDAAETELLFSYATEDSAYIITQEPYVNESSIYMASMDQIATSLDEQAAFPRKFRLEQNYPNPFNPSTVIRFAIPSDSEIQLSVYDINGRLVSRLSSGFYRAGTHSVQWNAQNMASGVYLYRLAAPGYSKTQKMVLIK